MAEDFTSKVLNDIRADIAALASRVDAGFARMDTNFARIENDIRGLSRIAVGLMGSVESIEARLARLEADHERLP